MQFLAILRNEAEVIQPDTSLDVVRDSDDDAFLEVALEADADYVVSGDGDLLAVGQFERVEVASPDAFVRRLE